jgi:hypothetical protein
LGAVRVMLNRRSFLGNAARVFTGLAFSHSMRGWGSTITPISIRLTRAAPFAHVPANFIGLGYEKSSAAVAGLLSVKNSRYVQLLSNLGDEGVLRIGGIVSDFSRYDPDGRSAAEPKNTVITHANLKQLGGFLEKTGWTAIWSLNFGRGSLVEAIREAKDVAAVLGPHLDAIELGNEVENYELREGYQTLENASVYLSGDEGVAFGSKKAYQDDGSALINRNRVVTFKILPSDKVRIIQLFYINREKGPVIEKLRVDDQVPTSVLLPPTGAGGQMSSVLIEVKSEKREPGNILLRFVSPYNSTAKLVSIGELPIGQP